MRRIQLNKSGVRFWSVLWVILCVLLPLSFFSNFNDISIMQEASASVADQGSSSKNCGNHDTWTPDIYQNPMADIFFQYTEISYNTQNLLTVRQQLSTLRKASCMLILYGLSYSFLVCSISIFISIYSQILVIGFGRHVVVPHSIHAPPIFLLETVLPNLI